MLSTSHSGRAPAARSWRPSPTEAAFRVRWNIRVELACVPARWQKMVTLALAGAGGNFLTQQLLERFSPEEVPVLPNRVLASYALSLVPALLYMTHSLLSVGTGDAASRPRAPLPGRETGPLQGLADHREGLASLGPDIALLCLAQWLTWPRAMEVADENVFWAAGQLLTRHNPPACLALAAREAGWHTRPLPGSQRASLARPCGRTERTDPTRTFHRLDIRARPDAVPGLPLERLAVSDMLVLLVAAPAEERTQRHRFERLILVQRQTPDTFQLIDSAGDAVAFTDPQDLQGRMAEAVSHREATTLAIMQLQKKPPHSLAGRLLARAARALSPSALCRMPQATTMLAFQWGTLTAVTLFRLVPLQDSLTPPAVCAAMALTPCLLYGGCLLLPRAWQAPARTGAPTASPPFCLSNSVERQRQARLQRELQARRPGQEALDLAGVYLVAWLGHPQALVFSDADIRRAIKRTRNAQGPDPVTRLVMAARETGWYSQPLPECARQDFAAQAQPAPPAEPAQPPVPAAGIDFRQLDVSAGSGIPDRMLDALNGSDVLVILMGHPATAGAPQNRRRQLVAVQRQTPGQFLLFDPVGTSFSFTDRRAFQTWTQDVLGRQEQRSVLLIRLQRTRSPRQAAGGQER